MKAAICREFGKPLSIEEVELARPGPGEVRVGLRACAICHSDIIFMDGGWGGPLPAVYGHETAGVVEEVGEGVADLQPGDHVLVTLIRSCGRCFFCAQGSLHLCEGDHPLRHRSPISQGGKPIVHGLGTGGFAEAALVDRSQVAPIPREIPFASACLLSCGVITGLGAVVNTVGVRQGSSVVVVGAGGVGLNSIQGAALSGCHPVIAADLRDDKLEVARTFGASHGVNPSTQDAAAEVRKLTGGRGADYVFVAVGSASAAEGALAMLRREGTLCMVGMPENGAFSRIELGNVANNGQRIVGSKMGSTRLALDIPKLVGLYEQGRLKLDELVSGRFPLDAINEACAEVRAGSALRNVIEF